MKIKNTIMKIVIMMVAIIMGISTAVSFASNATESKVLALKYYRYVYSDGEYKTTYGYGYNTTTANHKPIFQIYETGSNGSILSTNYYCLNATVGDSWYSGTIGTETTYNMSFNLDDSSDLSELAQYSTTNSVYSNIANSAYLNQILWILDNMYVPDTSATDEKNEASKMALLAQAGIVHTSEKTYTWDEEANDWATIEALEYEQQDGYSDYSAGTRQFTGYYNYYDSEGNRYEVVIDDDLVEVAQQAALWYFTNYLSGDKESAYDVAYDSTEGLKFRLVYGEDGTTTSSWQSLTEYDEEDTDLSTTVGTLKEEQAAILCAYLIEAANKYATSYTSTSGSPVSVSPSTSEYETVEISGTYYYVVGPITISEEYETTYTLENKILINGEEVSGTYLSDANGTATNKTVQESVGTEFYVTIPVNSINSNSIKIGFEGTYTTNKKTLWISTTGEEQPVVEVGPSEEDIDLSVTVVIEGEFDLALRKAIIEITDSEGNSKYVYNEEGKTADREITYDTSTITSDSTATYNHRKDPVVVETGDIVTYSITVYNEGDIAGYATTIVDKLPDGLALAGYTENGTTTGTYTADGIEYTYEYIPSTNVITITNVSKNVLAAYDGGTTLSSETIQIECEVVATASSSTNTYLTNIAYISGEYNSESDEEVTTDRDSSTENSPSATQETTGDEYNGYTGGEDKDVYNDTNNSEYFPGEEDDDDFEIIVIPQAEFDLALQKYISSVYSDGTETAGRTAPTIDTTGLISGDATTATYTQDKSAISVECGDYVIYTFTVYNEGEVDGYVNKITDNIPAGLEFLYVADENNQTTDGTYVITVCDSTGNFNTLEVDEATYNLVVKHNSYWSIDADENNSLYTDTYNGDTTISVTCDVAAYLGGTNTLLKAFDSKTDDGAGSGLSSVSVTLMLRVSDSAENGIELRNEAAITEAEDPDGNKQDAGDLKDRDSQTDEWEGKDGDKEYQDDEDYDRVIIVKPEGSYDLVLVKEDENGEQLNSTATFTVNGEEVKVTGKLTIADDVEINAENVNSADTYVIVETVAPDEYCEFEGTITITVTKKLSDDGKSYEVDKVTYVVTDENGEEFTTTDANVYLNEEGNIYVEVKDYEKPNGSYDLILVKEDENGEQLDSTATFTVNGEEVQVKGKLTVAEDITINESNVETADTYVIVETVAPDGYCEFEGTITITVTKKLSDDGKSYEVDKVTYVVTDENGEEFTTTDAKVYLNDDGNIYVEVIDYEEVQPDLALTKFIVAVSDDLSIDDGEWLTSSTTSENAGSSTNPYTRATSVDTTELRDNANCHDATYTMVKDPLTVPAQSYVLYNIRIYNEGNIDVYAGEVTDYLPTYLDFVECDFNTAYGWTVDSDGKTIRTNYLAYEEGSTTNLLKAFDKETDDGAGSGLDYRDIQVLCRVNDNAPTNKTITNIAEITEYQDEDGEDLPKDIDSTPDNVNENDEDDDDYEEILIQTFDLSLLKYVTTVYVTVDGTTETIQTGNVGDENDTIPKVEINRKKVDSTIVIFEYTIKITNEGDIEGYACEITDYVPEGLKYYAEDNEDGVWTDEGNNVISTRALEKTLLEPGESATVTVKLRWINGSDNLGLKTNTAEISEDYNEYGVPDRDSTPDNQVSGEDDIDDAQVLLSISTGIGQVMTYVGAITLILIVFGTGIVSIKKFVL